MSKLTEILEHYMMTNTDTGMHCYTDEGIDKTEQAIQAYIAEVIGEDEPEFPSVSVIEHNWSSNNRLRAEQRKRAGL